MWKQRDADGNNALTEQELRYAMKNKRISEKLSHLVCLHTSEWSYKESKLSSLKSKLNTLFDEGIKEEEDAACKQELKDKRKAVLDAMEARVKNLSWWKEVQDNTLFDNNPFSPGAAKKEKKEAAKPVEIPFAPEEELKGPTLFPVSKPKVYHFHPLAFVRQMRRQNGICFCNRDFTEDEVKDIVTKMRESENYTNTNLFYSENCPLPTDHKTYKKLTEELNKTIKKYDINTCIRKIHFLAQCYWEGDRFKTTLEYASGEGYNPGQHSESESHDHIVKGDGPRYKGRGLMQLTWRDTQKEYFISVLDESPHLLSYKNIDDLFDRGNHYKEKYIFYSKGKDGRNEKNIKYYDVDSAALIAKDLFFALDSAGWFWKNYKIFRGKNLNYWSDFGDKYVDRISILVNGGGNGKAERKIYYSTLCDKVFKLKEVCSNYEDIKYQLLLFHNNNYFNVSFGNWICSKKS